MRAARVLGLALVVTLALIGAANPRAGDERVVDLETHAGSTIRFLLRDPPNAVGSVILLAGGHGRLDISPSGALGWGAGNQVVRTRAAYAAAGYVVAVPDVPSDMKGTGFGQPVIPAYRWSEGHARAMGTVIAYLSEIKKPVWIIGTSRGSLSAASAVARLTNNRPQGLVLTSGMLMARPDHAQAPSVETVVDLDRLDVPVLLVHHESDGCPFTPASDVERFRKRLTRAPSVDVVMLRGGRAEGDPCEARSHHGFLGLDDEVVGKIVDWLDRQPR